MLGILNLVNNTTTYSGVFFLNPLGIDIENEEQNRVRSLRSKDFSDFYIIFDEILYLIKEPNALGKLIFRLTEKKFLLSAGRRREQKLFS